MYNATVPVFIKSLTALRAILEKAENFVAEKKIEESVILQARLALDQFPFIQQVQIACDNAKGTAGRLADVEIPKMEDSEKTLGELKERIDKTVSYLQAFTFEQFEGSEDRKVPIYFMPGKYMLGLEYVTDLAIPNFYFHLTTAYDILRHNGMNLGKGDYVGSLSFKDL